jgi:hypothetical protein
VCLHWRMRVCVHACGYMNVRLRWFACLSCLSTSCARALARASRACMCMFMCNVHVHVDVHVLCMCMCTCLCMCMHVQCACVCLRVCLSRMPVFLPGHLELKGQVGQNGQVKTNRRAKRVKTDRRTAAASNRRAKQELPERSSFPELYNLGSLKPETMHSITSPAMDDRWMNGWT